MKIDNAVMHLYRASPYIVKACVNLREGKRIRFQLPLKDKAACMRFLRQYDHMPVKVITHS